MLEWIKDNADWLFSGLAIFILSSIGPIIKYIKNKREEAKRKKEQEETIKLQNRVLEAQLEDLRQKAMPSIEASGDVMANKVDRVVKMQLINNGNTAKLISVDNLPAGWIEIPLTYPYLLHKNESVWLQFRITGMRDFCTDFFSFDLYFDDTRRNHYKSTISVTHQGVRVNNTILLQND